MQSSPMLSLVILGGLAGFGVYCLSHAVQVWRIRNGAAPSAVADAPAARRRWWVARVSALCMLLGTLGLVASYITGLAAERKGRLLGVGLFAPRLAQGLEVDAVFRAREVRAGDVLARLRSREREAEIQALKTRRDSLAAEKRLVSHTPLELDAEVVRRRQEVDNERRHLQYSADQFLPARDLVRRERLRDRLAKQEQLRTLGSALDRLQREREQAGVRLGLRQDQLTRSQKLSPTGAASAGEFAERKTELDYQTAEVAKLDQQIANARQEVAQLENDLRALDELSESQGSELAGLVTRVRERLASVVACAAPADADLSADVIRAKARRQARLDQLDVELAGCEGQLAAMERSLSIVSPFAGRIAYRDPSPKTVFGSAPLLVLAPADGFRLRVRISRAQAAALERAGQTTLQLLQDGVERRFPGYLTARESLAQEKGFVMAELTCEPPAETVRDLATGKAVTASLLWSPPLYTSALFLPSVAALLLSAVGWVAGTRRLRGAAGSTAADGTSAPHSAARLTRPLSAHPQFSQPQTAPTPAPLMPHPAPAAEAATSLADPAAAESGTVGPILRLLGSQLREAVLSRQWDPTLLAAVEWGLDRHHVRAVRLLSEALDEDPQLIAAVEALAAVETSVPGVERVTSILRTVGGDRVRAVLRRRARGIADIAGLSAVDEQVIHPRRKRGVLASPAHDGNGGSRHASVPLSAE